MSIIPDRLLWMFSRRLKILREVTGFHASLFSYADAHCTFSSFGAVHKGSSLFSVRLGVASYVAGARINHATIGNFCSIGPGACIGLGRHPTNWLSTHPAFYSRNGECKLSLGHAPFEQYRTTVIGNDVWIGANAIVMDGLRIGDGAIVAAGAVVTHDVPPFAVVAGVPAKTIKQRFDAATGDALLQWQWWHLPIETLRKLSASFTRDTQWNEAAIRQLQNEAEEIARSRKEASP